uniref:Uncharacterized protein n=1 Tax=Anguilla anguilla TaxID=7936 RepID=A0A0E9SI42_ANGAN
MRKAIWWNKNFDGYCNLQHFCPTQTNICGEMKLMKKTIYLKVVFSLEIYS